MVEYIEVNVYMSGNNEREISLRHSARVLKGLRLIRAGRTDDEIVQNFRHLDDFDETATRYHIDRLRAFERARITRVDDE